MPANRSQRPRELRRRVLLPARIRSASGWSDACILNVSTRGLMVQAGHPLVQGSMIEIRHQQHVIHACVVWRDGQRAGLQAETRVPVDHILSLADAPELRLTAVGRKPVERRRRPRSAEWSRHQGRLLEFASIAVIAVGLSGAAFALVAQTLAQPLAQVRAALDVQSAPAASR